MMIANILIPLDGSPLAEHALPYAVALAGAAQSRIRLVHMMREAETPAKATSELDAAARIELLASQLRLKGLQATAKTVVGHRPADTILAAAGAPPADLIVMSTHGNGGFGRWLYGSVADQVLRRSDVPVLLIPPTCAHPWPTGRRPKILIPLDGSEHSEAALGPARMLGYAIGADLLLMRVVEPEGDAIWQFDPVGVVVKRSPAPDIREARAYLNVIADSSDPAAPPADVLIDEGDPAWVIPAIARQEGIDLIVMATHGRTGLARLAMGSVAITTLQRAHVPVLLVRPPGLERQGTESGEELAEETEAMLPEVWPPAGVR